MAGDSIWNGFIDNAAGCAMLLEIARAMAHDPPPRSVAFLFVTAEEQGLLGSNWFVYDPPVPLDRIRAVLNLDAGAPRAPPAALGLVRELIRLRGLWGNVSGSERIGRARGREPALLGPRHRPSDL